MGDFLHNMCYAKCTKMQGDRVDEKACNESYTFTATVLLSQFSFPGMGYRQEMKVKRFNKDEGQTAKKSF